MILCVPVSEDGVVDPRWGRADRIAVAEVLEGAITSWQEIEVSWSRLHDEGSPARHHARVARFLKDHHVETVVANHVGEGMIRMVNTMGLTLTLDALGDARTAVLSASNN
ncbi:MAG: NifB/NifX family molybdenum-iron cluster-binding protein [Acidimicrobiales bacterium]